MAYMRYLVVGAAGLVGCLGVSALAVMLTGKPGTRSSAPLGTVLPASGGVHGTTAGSASTSIGARAQHVAAPASWPPTHKAVASPGYATATPPRRSVSVGSSVPPRAAPAHSTSTTSKLAKRPPTTVASSKAPARSTPTSSAGTTVARTQPSIAAVEAAIQGLKPYVHTLLTPSVAQVDKLGNEVCTAFDQGNTSSQVEAAVTQRLNQLPLTEVLPGAGAYVVDTSISLYCPGYGSKRV